MANTPTREHREAAALAHFPNWTTDSPVGEWVASGHASDLLGGFAKRELPATAQAICDAEQRGRDAELAEVVAYLRRHTLHRNSDNANDIESGKHRAKGGK